MTYNNYHFDGTNWIAVGNKLNVEVKETIVLIDNLRKGDKVAILFFNDAGVEPDMPMIIEATGDTVEFSLEADKIPPRIKVLVRNDVIIPVWQEIELKRGTVNRMYVTRNLIRLPPLLPVESAVEKRRAYALRVRALKAVKGKLAALKFQW